MCGAFLGPVASPATLTFLTAIDGAVAGIGSSRVPRGTEKAITLARENVENIKHQS